MTMTPSRQFLDRLALRLPIIQAPMAGLATPRLVAEVSNAGGLGSLAIGASTLAQARQMIEQTHALTNRSFNVNVFCHAPALRDAAREAGWLAYLAPLFAETGTAPPTTLDEIYSTFVGDEAAFELLLEQRPAVVSFHFGLPPARHIDALRAAGIYTMATATSVHEAALIEQAGIDAIVAQGIEAGGHRGVFDPQADDQRHSTSVLLRLLTRQRRLPVIAAGGIMDGHGIKAALELGAAAAQLGTAFLLCPESSTNAGYRANLASERAAATRMTRTISGREARGMDNRFIAFCEAPGSPPAPSYPVAYDAAKQLNAAASLQGNNEFAAQWAGQGAPLVREMPAAQLMATLAGEMAG